jgi:osmotically-inducible protein OsmY
MRGVQVRNGLSAASAVVVAKALHALAPAMAGAETGTGLIATHASSKAPASDSWITAKGKAGNFADDTVKGPENQVSAARSVVTRAGMLDSKTRVDTSIRLAMNAKGVADVDSLALKVRPS